MKRSLAVLAAALLTTAAASAQGYPDTGTGIERGIEQVSNSGQVGSITIVPRGASTSVTVNLKGTPNRAQSVRIYRGKSCENDIAERPAFFLSDMHGGSSSSTVPVAANRLLSGNYNVLVFSGTQAGARVTACGHLYLQ